MGKHHAAKKRSKPFPAPATGLKAMYDAATETDALPDLIMTVPSVKQKAMRIARRKMAK